MSPKNLLAMLRIPDTAIGCLRELPLAAFVVHTLDVPEEEGSYPAPFDGEKLSLGRNLGKAAGSERLGMWHTGIAHCFVNHGTGDCLLLCVGERRRDIDGCSYPEDREYDEHRRRTEPHRHWAR